MKKILHLISILIFGFIFISCSSSEDESVSPYTAYSNMPSSIIGTWTYKVSGAENIDATLIFLSDGNMNLKINNYSYNGKAFYPTSGGDGSIYFKLDKKDSYSKISWFSNTSLPNNMRIKIDNVENYTIDKTFQKKH